MSFWKTWFLDLEGTAKLEFFPELAKQELETGFCCATFYESIDFESWKFREIRFKFLIAKFLISFCFASLHVVSIYGPQKSADFPSAADYSSLISAVFRLQKWLSRKNRKTPELLARFNSFYFEFWKEKKKFKIQAKRPATEQCIKTRIWEKWSYKWFFRTKLINGKQDL